MTLRPLTPREKRLIAAMALVAFVLANVIGLHMLMGQRARLMARFSTLQTQAREAKTWLDEKDLWFRRAAWLDENQPADDPHSTDDEHEFYSNLEKSAAKYGVKIVKREFIPPDPDVSSAEAARKAYDEFAVQLTVSGSMEALVKWLADLQQPTHFRAIKRVAFQLDPQDATKLLCDIIVARWYRSGDAALPPS